MRVKSNNTIVIEDVHFVVAGPRALEPGRLECRDASSQRRPQHRIERVVIGLEWRIVQVRARGNAGDVSGPFGADPEAGWIDQQRESLHSRWTRNHIHGTSARRHGQIAAGEPRDGTRPGTGRIDDKAACDLAARAPTNRVDCYSPHPHPPTIAANRESLS